MPTRKNYPAYIISRTVYIRYVTLHLEIGETQLRSVTYRDRYTCGVNFSGNERIQRNDIYCVQSRNKFSCKHFSAKHCIVFTFKADTVFSFSICYNADMKIILALTMAAFSH